MNAIDFKNITALVVDDQANFREAIVYEFEILGCKVLAAQHGKEAFDIFKKNKVDLIISDIKMPEWDGMKLLSEIRNISPITPPMILMTGFADVKIYDAYGGGANAFIGKPFRPEDFNQLITNLLQPISNRWLTRPEVTIQSTIVRTAHKNKDYLNSTELQLGNGGMFIAVSPKIQINLAELQLNRFVEFDLSDVQDCIKTLKGVGKVVWIRNEQNTNLPAGCGILFEYLGPDCHEDFIKYVNSLNAAVVIPSGTNVKQQAA